MESFTHYTVLKAFTPIAGEQLLCQVCVCVGGYLCVCVYLTHVDSKLMSVRVSSETRMNLSRSVCWNSVRILSHLEGNTTGIMYALTTLCVFISAILFQ